MIRLTIFLSLLIGMASPSFAVMKGTLESLINTWDSSREICETVSDEAQKANHCSIMEAAAEALEAKGFCKGMHTLRFEEDNTKYSPGLKDEYEIFEKLTRNRWFPCVHESFLDDKSQALYTNFWDMSLEELQIFKNWLVQNEDGSFDVDINKLILRDTWADQNCRGGGADESFFWGECGIRNSHNRYFKEYGICHGGYNNPPHLMNVLGGYIWPFRNKFVPCLYNDLVHQDAIN